MPEHVRRRRRLPGRYAAARDAGRRRAATARATPAAFIAESILGVAGQIVLPDGYLRGASTRTPARPARVCIADEVQVGFGRVGAHVLGLRAPGRRPRHRHARQADRQRPPDRRRSSRRRAIARSFETGMEYFNTFGGNPVSCAAALAGARRDRRRATAGQTPRASARASGRARELAARHARSRRARRGPLPRRRAGARRRDRRGRAARAAGVLLSTDGAAPQRASSSSRRCVIGASAPTRFLRDARPLLAP